MTVAAGTRLGPYEIIGQIGAGGMGEVYRARDTRLGREVAIKVLPPSLTMSEQARQRFEREARTISQLSHPHICALYDVGREGSTEYLVMELLEGQTLAERLSKGFLPLDQALRYGTEIADALDRAHRQGIVHRDLKPGNVMLTSSGVKILDFGLARAAAGSPAATSLTGLPTETPLTEAGTVLGTVQYMAPEQLEGKEADARTDIFALGMVLYEMATGRTAFSGATRASLIGAILRDEPPPISREQPVSPRALDRVVATCLAKEPEDRWQTARDVALQLEGIRRDRSAPEPAVPSSPRTRRVAAAIPWAIAAAAVGLAAVVLVRGSRPASPPRVLRTFLLPPPGTSFEYGPNSAPAALSPDGRRIVFGAREADGATSLWIRDLDSTEPYVLPGGEGAFFPFWSPDSRFIGFFARGTLKVVEASPSPQPPRVLASDILEARGGTWGPDGTILYSPGNLSPLMRVPATGGQPVAIPLAGDEKSQRWPRFLPDGRHYLIEVRRADPAGSGPIVRSTFLASLDSTDKRQILSDDRSPTYAPPGFLLFGRGASLMAVACDSKSLAIRGEAVALDSRIEGFVAPGSPYFSVTEDVLVYSPIIGAQPSRLFWLDRSGKPPVPVGPAGYLFGVALSADGLSAVTSAAEGPSPPDLWSVDTTNGRAIRLTRDRAPQLIPVLAPDARFYFSSYTRGPWDIWEMSTKGKPEPKIFLETESTATANDVSPDGRYLLYREFNPGTLGDLKFVALDGDRTPRAFVGTADDETNGDFSHDGRWVAYASDGSGRKEIYVASFPEPARRFRVTSDGGAQPRWSHDGKELFYVRSGQLFAVPVTRKGEDLAFGGEQPLFRLPLFTYGDSGFDTVTRYDVAPDGRFLALLRAEEAPEPLVIILNWAEALKKP